MRKAFWAASVLVIAAFAVLIGGAVAQARATCQSGAACTYPRLNARGQLITYPTGTAKADIHQGETFKVIALGGHWPDSVMNHTGGWLWLRHGHYGSFNCARPGKVLNTYRRYDRAKWTKNVKHSCSSDLPPAGSWALP